MIKRLSLMMLLFSLLAPAGRAVASIPDVIRLTDTNSSLDERVSQAIRLHQPSDAESWIGYSIRRMMYPHEHFFSGIFISGSMYLDREKPTLHEVLYRGSASREAAETTLRRHAANVLQKMERRPEKENKTLREVAILLRFSKESGIPVQAEILTFAVPIDFKGRRLIWLGNADPAESYSYLTRLYTSVKRNEIRESLITAIGCHSLAGLSFPFLSKVLLKEADGKLREEAARWMGDLDSPEALRILAERAVEDPSIEVREQAVYGIGQMSLPEAGDVLIDLAGKPNPGAVREAAMYQIADLFPGERAMSVLQDILDQDAQTEAQEAALYALAELPGSEDRIIRAAKTHRSREIRETAIHILGESRHAFETLTLLAFSDPDREIRESAMVAMSESYPSQAVDVLIRIMDAHPDRQTRETAIHLLVELKDARAKAALKKMMEEP